MTKYTFFCKVRLIPILFLSLLGSLHAISDPSMVARLSYIRGASSFLPAGEKKWVKTSLNYPLVTGDRVWAGNNAFLELQLNSALVRLDQETSVKFLNLHRKSTQIQLSCGSIILKVRQINPGQLLEVSTPHLAFSPTRPGLYRLFVNTRSNTTSVALIQGSAKVIAAKAKRAYQMNNRKSCSFSVDGLQQCTRLPTPDAFDRMSKAREPIIKRTRTRYVSSEMIGYEDLNTYGSWRLSPQYGNIWIPEGVDQNWAPYRNGHWAWIRTWGWTWVDAQPWGFAPFHYGRWVYYRGRWVWAPGASDFEPVYAPALVVFVGGNNFNLSLSTGTSSIAWVPLAPGEIYIPPRPMSRAYFMNVNQGSEINNTQLINTYNTYVNHTTNNITNIQYQNINVPNGVTAVPTKVFKQSEPVKTSLQSVPKDLVREAPKTPVAVIAPDKTSALGGTTEALTEPPKSVIDQATVVTTPPPPPPMPFSEGQKIVSDSDKLLQEKKEEAAGLEKEALKTEPKMELVNPEQASKPIDAQEIGAEKKEIKPDEQIKPQEAIKPEEQIKPQEEPQVQAQEAPQIKPQEEPQVQAQEAPQIKPQEEPQVQAQEAPQIKPQEEPQVQAQEAPQIKPQEEPQMQAQEPPQMQAQEEPQMQAHQEPPQMQAQEEPQMQAQEPPQMQAQEEPQMQAQEPSQMQAQAEPQEQVQP